MKFLGNLISKINFEVLEKVLTVSGIILTGAAGVAGLKADDQRRDIEKNEIKKEVITELKGQA